jgi:hypothetical protein
MKKRKPLLLGVWWITDVLIRWIKVYIVLIQHSLCVRFPENVESSVKKKKKRFNWRFLMSRVFTLDSVCDSAITTHAHI